MIDMTPTRWDYVRLGVCCAVYGLVIGCFIQWPLYTLAGVAVGIIIVLCLEP